MLVIRKCKSENIEHILDKRQGPAPVDVMINDNLCKWARNFLHKYFWSWGLLFKFQCKKCGVSSELALWDEKVSLNSFECPPCRQVMCTADGNELKNSRDTKVECYKCHDKFDHNQFVRCKIHGSLCPNEACGTPQIIAKLDYILNVRHPGF